VWFKGAPEAVAAVHAMTEPAELTVLAPDPDTAGELDGARVVGGLDARQMAATYAAHDVVLKLSRVEGLGMPPIEAFHVGVPAVVAPYTGHSAYLDHGRNGLVVGYDDVPGTARALDGLARDRDRLKRLGQGALETARDWPSAESALEAFAAAVEDLVAGPEPDPAAAFQHLQRSQRRWLELSREHLRQLEAKVRGLHGAVEWHEHALEEAAAHHKKLTAEVEDVGAKATDAYRKLEELQASRAYRLAVGARRLVRRRR
jgi:hypothetical protein